MSEIESFVEGENALNESREVISESEFWSSVEKKNYLNATELANAGISKLKILEVYKPYKKIFGDRVRMYMDLKVIAEDGAGKGTEYIFSIGVQNARVLREKLGIDTSQWIGKVLKVSKEKSGSFWYVKVEDVVS